MLYHDHTRTSKVDNVLHSQFLSDSHFIEIGRGIYILITPGSHRVLKKFFFSSRREIPNAKGMKLSAQG